MVEPDDLMLEHLRAIRGDMAKMADWMQTMSVEMTAIRQHLAGVVTIQEHDHGTSHQSRCASTELKSVWS
jgi:hypothetical protein